MNSNLSPEEYKQVISAWEENNGIFSIGTRLQNVEKKLLSVVYTPGVAEPCRVISADKSKSFPGSGRGKTIGLVGVCETKQDSLEIYPLLEAKAVLLKKTTGLDVYPLVAETTDNQELMDIIAGISPGLGGVGLDNVAPEDKLKKSQLDIPVFNFQAEAEAIVTLAFIQNYCRLFGKEITELAIWITDDSPVNSLLAGWLENILNVEKLHMGREKANFLGLVDVLISGKNFRRLSKLSEGLTSDSPALIFNFPAENRDKFSGNENILFADEVKREDVFSSLLALPALLLAKYFSSPRGITSKEKVKIASGLAGLLPGNKLTRRNLLPGFNCPQLAFEPVKKLDMPAERRGLSFASLRQSVYETEPVFETGEEFWEQYPGGDTDRLGRLYYKTRKGPIYCSAAGGRQDIADIHNFIYPGPEIVRDHIKEQPGRNLDLIARGNLVGVITDGSAVLGLGDIGPRAARPVMEGKSFLFKAFAGIDALPVCVETAGGPDSFIKIVEKISGSFGGINLEDIAAPGCFEIERKLKERLNIPVFHDDQHGTAVVILAALKNALRLKERDFSEIRVVINGAGASGVAVARILKNAGVKEIDICDSKGVLYSGRENMNPEKEKIARALNSGHCRGGLKKQLEGADVFIGLSVGELLEPTDIEKMASAPVVFALANPVPEIYPSQARQGGAYITATGRSDFANQVNNALAFPGIFRGALAVGSTSINESMKQAAARALAGCVAPDDLSTENILPDAMDVRIVPKVASAVAQTAIEEKIARKKADL